MTKIDEKDRFISYACMYRHVCDGSERSRNGIIKVGKENKK